MGSERKLNLGCGVNYLHGYINIDNNNTMVADQYCDIQLLPYESQSVDEILASHVIEHFDINKIPFVLADWINLITPGGKLIIEVPHLKKAISKINHSNLQLFTNQLKFIYGIDHNNNSHKSGFTPKILKKLLMEYDVEDIKLLKPHRYIEEGSFRIICTKSTSHLLDRKNWLTRFMSLIWRNSQSRSSLFFDSFFTEIINEMNHIFLQKGADFFKNENISIFTGKIAILDSSFIRIFLEIVPPSRSHHIQKSQIASLSELEITKRLAIIWIKSKKDRIQSNQDYQKFINYWASRFLNFMTSSSINSEDWQYWNSVEIEENVITSSHFGWNMIQIYNILELNKKRQQKNTAIIL